MAQADCITTAIRQLMSRGRPPKSTSPVRAAHTEFVAALAGNVPHPIHSDGDSEDLEGRADHLEKVFAALHVYLTAIIAETAQGIPRQYPRRYQQFRQTRWGIRDAAVEMRGHEIGGAARHPAHRNAKP